MLYFTDEVCAGAAASADVNTSLVTVMALLPAALRILEYMVWLPDMDFTVVV